MSGKQTRRERVLICGSREWRDGSLIRRTIHGLKPGCLIIHGGAKGADRIAGDTAEGLGYHTAVVRPLWDTYGKGAGHLRNVAMLDLEPDRVIAFWDGKSPGTRGTIDEARRRGIPVEVVTFAEVAA